MNPHLQQILHDITVRITKLEEAQQQRTWVGLTDDEVRGIYEKLPYEVGPDEIRAIAEMLRKKNI